MIYTYRKYKDISDYVVGESKTKIDEEFTIVDKCNGLSFEKETEFSSRCFACLFCYFSDGEIQKKFKTFWGYDFITTYADSAFKGIPVRVPNSKQVLKNPFPNLESFTKVDETKNIQPWATGLLFNACSGDNRISMEVPIFNGKYDRNGRLDICSITKDCLLVMESKTTLDDALADERFVEQRYKYIEEIKKSTKNYTYITLIGGSETDLFPLSSPHCTSKVGRKAERFYKLLLDNDIKFISATALWLMVCKYINSGSTFSWDKFLPELFAQPKTIGLVSAGAIRINSDNIPVIESLS